MTPPTFRDALSVLSKSSPFSVKTMSFRARDGFDELKDWLYIEQDIEKDMLHSLSKAAPGDIIFLCGSSGDGKSEILTRAYQNYSDKVTFHLDATHSFQPNQSAVEALNGVFSEAAVNHQILVVGINIGMLGNYAQEGHEAHREVRDAMLSFLERVETPARYKFLNFEDYPKFKIENGIPIAPFAKNIMQRLTEETSQNPFYVAFSQGDVRFNEPSLYSNYRLLMLSGVQDAIIANIAKARLVKDQFVTARGLLDLLHHLLTGPGYLYDNLFAGEDNELVSRIATFDPALLRTRKLDQLVLGYELGLSEADRDVFLSAVEDLNIGFSAENRPTAASLVRLLYILQQESIGNNYHRQFIEEFSDKVMTEYAAVWKMHSDFDGSADAKTALIKFYRNVLTAGIFRYANRNAPELDKGEIVLGEFHGIKIAGLASLKPDFIALHQLAAKTPIAYFNVALKVDNEVLKPIPFNINLFGLVLRLNQGYRPNKYDKNAIVLLDELVEQVKAFVKRGDQLKLYRGEKQIKLKYEDGMIDTVGEI